MTLEPTQAMKAAVFILTLGTSAAWSAAAAAQQAPASNANCPPGAWFCEPTPAAPAPPAPAAPQAQPSQGQGLQPLPPPPAPAPAPIGGPPTVVYEPAPPPPVVIIRSSGSVPPPYEYRPRPAQSWMREREWGLQMRFDIGLTGREERQMTGFGLGLRYRMHPVFALQLSGDWVAGTDYNRLHREERALTVDALVFVNPRSRAQLYFLGGLGWANAHISTRDNGDRLANYNYFGAQLGAGLEIRLGRHFALHGDLRGFIRGRTDGDADVNPEFRDSSGRTTNTSGGGLITLGGVVYF